MAKKFTLDNIFLFLFLILFPFGQIIRIGIIHPLDVVVGMAAVYTIVNKLPKPEVFKYLENFLLVAFFSWTVSIFIFKDIKVLYGLLYLFRLTAYCYFFVYVADWMEKSKKNSKLIRNSVIVVAAASAFFGWIQYFVFPSIIPFKVWGWDEHLYRLVGTFLDPTFLGIILVIGFFVAIKKSKAIALFLLISIAFTYSRASYIAFGAGLVVFALLEKKIKLSIFFLMFFLFFLLILPKNTGGLGVNLTRTNTLAGRLLNYRETYEIFFNYPVFGIGYNNICLARNKYINTESVSSHSCSGSDSSILFILATTGVVGFLSLVYGITKFRVLNPIFIAIATHSLFSNSLFYPWVMGLIVLILATGLPTSVGRR